MDYDFSVHIPENTRPTALTASSKENETSDVERTVLYGTDMRRTRPPRETALPDSGYQVAFRDVLQVVGAHDLDVVAVVVFEDLQGVLALFGPVHRAPLLHALAGDGLAVAVFGVVGVDGALTAHVGVEDVVGELFHHLKDVASVHIILVVAGGVGDVEGEAPAGVPLGEDAVHGQTDLGVDVGPQGLLRRGLLGLQRLQRTAAAGHGGRPRAEGPPGNRLS